MAMSETERLIRQVWGEQGWQLPGAHGGMSLEEAREAGIKRLIENRYPNFDARVAAVEQAVVVLQRRQDKRSSEDELLAIMSYHLPFLTTENRRALARALLSRSG